MKKVSSAVTAKLSTLSKALLIINLIFLISDFSLFILYGSMLALLCSWVMMANIMSIKYKINMLYKDHVVIGYLRCAFIPFSVVRDAKQYYQY
ncbi:hypothetical protein [Photobacterium aquimaris]|uniref:Uncharacterized protein n=1 Tax=Photobacterium aquimaris TaxID=512643 RepID=A0A1Y6KWC6_9GAMM|nr:hypothetical protein [Photobacterium aquimaris]SMY16483.1 hypothetical protein PAQU9191_01714 [Photobacterium aquimaris]